MKQQLKNILLASLLSFFAINISAQNNETVVHTTVSFSAPLIKKVVLNQQQEYDVYFNGSQFHMQCEFVNEADNAVQRHAAKLLFGDEYASLDDAVAEMKKLWKKSSAESRYGGEIEMGLTLEYSVGNEQEGGFACYRVSANLNGSANIVGLPQTEEAKKMKTQYFRLSNGIDRSFIFDMGKKQVLGMDDIFQPAVAQKLKTMFGTEASLYAEDRCLQIVSKAGEGLFIFSPVTEKNFTDYFKQLVDWQQLSMSNIDTPNFLRGQMGIENYLQKGGLMVAADGDNDCDTVVVSLIVREDGSVMQPNVEQKTGDNFDEQLLLSLCGKMPKWMPAYENGKPVTHEAAFTLRLKSKVFDVVEQMPSFPEGQQALFKYISENLKYPEVCEENGVQGRVIVGFIVESDGTLTNAKIRKSADPFLDKEAKRLVMSMPKWIPGRQNGKAVRVNYVLPVTFRLK